MAEKKSIWICPLSSLSFKSKEAFEEHIKTKLAKLEQALRHPERHEKVIRLADPED